jgi:hypothetical protein
VLTGLSITGSTSVTVGRPAHYTAKATYSDGSSRSLTTGLVWSTSSSSLSTTITHAGVVTAPSAGTVMVQVAYGGLTAQLAIGVSPFVGATIYVSTSGLDTNAGTQASPVRTIQKGVTLANQANTAGNNAVVSIAPGIYREAVIIDTLSTAKTLTLEGAGTSTVLTGADDWSIGWTLQGNSTYVHSWPYKWGMKPLPNGWYGYWNWDGNGYKRDVLRRSEMVYVNGTPLRGVLTLAQLAAPGTFFVDETNSKLYMLLPTGVALSNAVIEVGIRKTPLLINGRNNVTLRNFAVMRSQGAIQESAVQIANQANLTIDGLTVRWTASTGLSTAAITNLHIVRSVFDDNGINGFSDWHARGALFEDNELARNNWRGWPAEQKGWDAVHKWTEARDVTIRRSRFIDNFGHGVWFDGDNQRVIIEDNFIARNGADGLGNGIYLEINGGPITIQRNRICSNAAGGIADGRSNNVSVLNNEISNNAYYQIDFTGSNVPVLMTDVVTGASYTVNSSNWTISDNKITGGPLASGRSPNQCYPGPCGWIIWTPDANHYSHIASTLTADRNQYYHTSATKGFRVPDTRGQAVNFATWRTLISTVKANEVNSTFSDPGALSCTPQF